MENTQNNVKDTLVASIKSINVETVHKICSGQVVLSLAVAVKELVENSLDAGATTIDIRFKNYGIDLIEVIDNGSGVTEDNFAGLSLKHHTSKLSDYSDLLGVSSFGFRGEALSSLCALAQMSITTRHSSCEYATHIEFDYKGNITKKTPCSRQVGTTVTLSKLFYSLPVRQKEFHKNAKREFNKMTQLLYAYCLISLGVKITCSNQTSTNKSIVFATQGSKTYKDNIACIFGIKQLNNLLEIKPEYEANIKDNIFKGLTDDSIETNDIQKIDDVDIDLSEDSNEADILLAGIPNSQKSSQGYINNVKPVQFTGYISSCAHGCGRSSTDRQFFYVNSRPCEPAKVIKLVNEIYRQYNGNQYPFVFLNVNLERTTVDVNVTPDKRKIFLTKEKIVLDVLKYSVAKLFENIPRTLKVETLDYKDSNDVKADVDQPRIFNSFLQKFASNSEASKSKETTLANKDNKDLKRKSTTMLDFVSSKAKKLENTPESKEGEDKYRVNNNVIDQNTGSSNEEIECDIQSIDNLNTHLIGNGQSDNTDDDKEIVYLEYTTKLPTTQIRQLSDVIIEKSLTSNCKNKNLVAKQNASPKLKEIHKSYKGVLTDKEMIGKNSRRSVILKTSMGHVKELASIYSKQSTNIAPERVKFKSVINPLFNKKCEEELTKEINKDSFKEMEMIGQFNLGFIITKLDDDLFIIDQHATDEIYNFETLQKTTELSNQKLVIPQQLELTGVNEQILMDNLDVFKNNGFTFEINENELPTKRVKLLTIPMSKNWIFGKDDIEELLFMLRENASEYCRPSRVRAMFASRACRKSVMIGTALSKSDMKKLVNHMGEIDKPWNCPHGRPTIRHLVNLAMLNTKRDE